MKIILTENPKSLVNLPILLCLILVIALVTGCENTTPSNPDKISGTIPEGNQIIYVSQVKYSNIDSGSEIYSMKSDGLNHVRLTNTPLQLAWGGVHGVVGRPSWSADGNKIAYLDFSRGYNKLEFLDISGKKLGNIELFAGYNRFDWSPNSESVVYTMPSYTNGQHGGSGSQLYLGKANDNTGFKSYTLVDFGLGNFAYILYPKWSSNGMKIAFTSNHETYPFIIENPKPGLEPFAYPIYLLDNLNPPHVQRIVDLSSGELDWSPDGTKIAFVSPFRELTNVDGSDIYILDINSKELIQLTTGSASEMNPKWSPDGKLIAFTTETGQNKDICIMDISSKKSTQLTNNSASDSDPVWSPDGSQLLFISNRDGNKEIYLITELTQRFFRIKIFNKSLNQYSQLNHKSREYNHEQTND